MADNGIVWTNGKRKLGDLIKWDRNPKYLSDKEAARLQNSIRKWGYSQPLEIDASDTIMDGHQRDNIMRMMEEYGPDCEIDVRIFPRVLTEAEREEYTVNKMTAKGSLDWNELASWDAGSLIDWGFDGDLLKGMNTDTSNLLSLLASENLLTMENAFARLPDEDRAPFQQMTFTVHDTQAETIWAALKAAKAMGDFDSENENSNGNALARICEIFIGELAHVG